MGMLTLQEMVDQVRLATGNKTDLDLKDGAIIIRLNESLLHLASPKVYRHKELEVEGTTPIVVGTASYPVDLDGIRTLHLISVAIINPTNTLESRRLLPIRERDGHRRPQSFVNGLPVCYELFGSSQITLHPTPNTQASGWDLSLRRLRVPTRFVASDMGAVSPLHEVWDEALVLGAVWRTWRTLKEWQLAEMTKAETGVLINEISDRVRFDAEDFDYMVDMRLDRVQ